MKSPERTKYQSVPLVDLADIAACDSKQAWYFNQLVSDFNNSKGELKRKQIKDQLKKWIEASNQTRILANSAPNLIELQSYAEKIAKVAKIGLKAINTRLSEKQILLFIKQIDSMNQLYDKLDITILPSIKSLLNGEKIQTSSKN